MRSKLVKIDPGQRRWVLAFEEGEDPAELLVRFARDQELGGAEMTGIGGFSQVTLGYFEIEKRAYRRIEVEEQVEVLALTGSVSRSDEGPKVHAHVVLGLFNGQAAGGHLLAGKVRPTLELIVTESPRALWRREDRKTGLALLDLER